MDGRGWPWKRKSTEKATTEKPAAAYEPLGVSLSSLASLESQEKYKNTNYVQITMDSYTHMSKMGDQVKVLEDEVKELKEKLTTANSEIKAKESSILQHAKVAEEAVSGWEKADAETLMLKHQLESFMLEKLSAEERASHLDDALKECTRQVRNEREENEKRLHDVILAKTTLWDQIKAELERNIDELNQRLFRGTAENAALSRSLQERSEMIIRISAEKSRAETEVEILKSNVQSYEKEISSLKFDLHVASRELEIRNEEKNMCIRSAEVAKRQHMEGVKQIAKLEAECQKLRGLVRKKLPGPAALAQMRLQVENSAEISADNRFSSSRRLEMEEEIKTLKELLAARSTELQISRNVCAKTLGKLKNMETQIQRLNPGKKNQSESLSSGNSTYPASATSISEDGFDEEGSSYEYGPNSSSDSHKVRVSRCISSSNKPEISCGLELMDDFLEIERLAANDADRVISISNSSDKVIDKLSTEQAHVHDDRQNQLISFNGVHDETREEHILPCEDTEQASNGEKPKKQDLEASIHHIHRFIIAQLQEMDGKELRERLEDFSAFMGKFRADDESSLVDLVLRLSHILRLSHGLDHRTECIRNVTKGIDEIDSNNSSSNLELEEKERLISELNTSRDLLSLTETQLKCVTESYKSLELHANDLEAQVQRLEVTLSEERCGHADTLALCKDLQETALRTDTCRKCSSPVSEIESAAEKLAVCQETINLLNQQLQALKPQTNYTSMSESPEKMFPNQNSEETLTHDVLGSPDSGDSSDQKSFVEDSLTSTPSRNHSDTMQADHSFRYSTDSAQSVHAIIKSSSCSSKSDHEKHTRGFGRFFTSKLKNGR